MHLLYFLVRFSLQQSLQTLRIIKKFTIFSTVIGLKKSPIFHLFTCQVVIGQFFIRKFVTRQFNKPITFKVVVLDQTIMFILIVVNFRGTLNKLCLPY